MNKKLAGRSIDWEFELVEDTAIFPDKSTGLLPKTAPAANARKKKFEPWDFGISLAKTSAGPFKAGDRVRLQASIDDFSRFKKNYTRAMGPVAIHYLKDSPNFLHLKLDEAKLTLIKEANPDARQTEPAKAEETPEGGAAENAGDELGQLLEDADEERLACSPDKKLLANLDRRLVTVWSVEERRQLHESVLDGSPLAAAFSPDGGSLVTADGEPKDAGERGIAPTGLTVVVCDSANNVLDTLVVPGEMENGEFEFTVPENLDEIRVFAVGNRIIGVGGSGGILHQQLRKELSETLTKSYFVARSRKSGGLGFVQAEIEQGVLIGISGGEAPRPLKLFKEMRDQIREDIAAGKRLPIIYRLDTETEFGGRITRTALSELFMKSCG